MNNLLKTALSDGGFVYTAELVLGRDHSVPDAEAFVRSAAQDARGIRIISITDLPGGNPALPPEGFIPFVLENGLTPIAHLTGKDGNRSFIESRLHELARLGAENVLALTGDAPRSGFQGRPKPVFDLDSVLILWLIRAMRAGIRYEAGRREVQSTPFDFYAGAVVNPFKRRQPDLMMQLYKLELKVMAGASFVISQIGYNLRKLYELRQYMVREGLGHIPVLANIYVPTATIARLMKDGEVPGCIVEDSLIRRLEGEKKPERLERAALMVAAVRDLGFAGAHIGGFGLTHADFLRIMDRSLEIGAAWKGRMEELVFEGAGDYYLFEAGTDGLSDGNSAYRQSVQPGPAILKARLGEWVHRLMIAPGSVGERFFLKVLKKHEPNGSGWRSGFWYRILGLSTVYRKAALGCVSCGDCLQDHLGYAGCSMRWCYKNLRNGPCGGSRPDGACEVDPAIPCIWNLVYLSTLRLKQDPRRFARTLIPPRDWCLDRTNALANRFAGIDNLCKRVGLDKKAGGEEKSDPR